MLGLSLLWTRVLSVVGAGAEAAQLWFASNTNYATTSFRTLNGTRLHHKSRQKITIGAGDRSDLVLSFYNWRLDLTGVVANTNAYNIVECAVELDGAASSVPVTFGGLRTQTVAAGATDVQSDALDPADFGLTEFAVGQEFWVRAHISVTTSGHSFPEGPNYEDARGGTFPDWLGWAYDPTSGTTSAIDGVGPINFSGGGDGRNVLSVVVLGRFAGAEANTWINVGDSIAAMSSDTLAGYGFAGYFARALTNSTFNGSWGAGMSFGVSGSGPEMWSVGTDMELATAYWQYGKKAVDEYGTNPLFFGASLATLQADDQALWAMLRAEGVDDVIHTYILPRTDSTDSWATQGNQTPVSADFQAGGDAELFNTWLSTQIGPTGISSVVAMNSVCDPGNRWKWITNGTPFYMCDLLGVHPTSVGHALMATELRAAMATY